MRRSIFPRRQVLPVLALLVTSALPAVSLAQILTQSHKGSGSAEANLGVAESRLPVRAVPLGSRPRQVETADFNGDGQTDVAALSGYGSLSVLLSDSDGNLTPSSTSPMQALTRDEIFSGELALLPIFDRMAVADVNGDARADIVVGGIGSAHVLVGDGDGGFDTIETAIAPEKNYELRDIALADFNGDGVLDLAAVLYKFFDAEKVAIVPGEGDATFDSQARTTLLDQALDSARLAVADVDGNDQADLVVGGRERADDGSGSGSVQVLLSSGPLQFESGMEAPVTFEKRPDHIELADMDEDGDPDMAVSLRFQEGLVLLVNNGDGQFSKSSNELDTGPDGFTLDDITGDGEADIVTETGSIFIAKPGLEFKEDDDHLPSRVVDIADFRPPPLPFTIADLEVAQLDDDGNADVVAAQGRYNWVHAWFGDGQGFFFRSLQGVLHFGSEPNSVSAGDIDGDGRTDVAVWNESTDRVGTWLSEPDGRLRPFKGFVVKDNLAFSLSTDPIIGNFNEDELGDLAYSKFDTVIVRAGKKDEPSGFVETFEHEIDGDLQSMNRADINGDDLDDLVVGHEDPVGATVLVAEGDGEFSITEVSIPADDLLDVLATDLTGDGVPELVAGRDLGPIEELSITVVTGREPEAAGTAFSAGETFKVEVPLVGDRHLLAAGNIDADAAKELVVAAGGRLGAAILDFGSSADTRDVEARVYESAGTVDELELVDVDNDGLDDLVTVDAEGSQIRVQVNTGDPEQRFREPKTIGTGLKGRGLHLNVITHGNFDQDARPELITANPVTNDLSFVDLRSDGVDELAAPGALAGSWFNPDRNGEGFEVYPFGENGLFVAWFTYDEEGNQQWYTAFTRDWPGRLGRAVQMPVFRQSGAAFTAFDPADVEEDRWGTLTLSFENCTTGTAGFSGETESVGPLTMRIERITGLPPGADCGQRSGAESFLPVSLSGMWFDPSRNGEGLMLDFFAQDSLFLTWFTYDDQGQPQWMIGLTRDWSGELGEPVTMALQRTSGAEFSDFNPGDTAAKDWGEATLTIESCTEATLEYDSSVGLGTGMLDLVRLATPGLPGIECRE